MNKMNFSNYSGTLLIMCNFLNLCTVQEWKWLLRNHLRKVAYGVIYVTNQTGMKLGPV